jgi:hypothetical protein
MTCQGRCVCVGGGGAASWVGCRGPGAGWAAGKGAGVDGWLGSTRAATCSCRRQRGTASKQAGSSALIHRGMCAPPSRPARPQPPTSKAPCTMDSTPSSLPVRSHSTASSAAMASARAAISSLLSITADGGSMKTMPPPGVEPSITPPWSLVPEGEEGAAAGALGAVPQAPRPAHWGGRRQGCQWGGAGADIGGGAAQARRARTTAALRCKQGMHAAAAAVPREWAPAPHLPLPTAPPGLFPPAPSLPPPLPAPPLPTHLPAPPRTSCRRARTPPRGSP